MMTSQPPAYTKFPQQQWPTPTEPASTSLSVGQPAVGYPQATGQAPAGYPGMPTGQAPGGYPGMPTGQAAAAYPGMSTGQAAAGNPGMPVGPVTAPPASQSVVVNQTVTPNVVVAGPPARPSNYVWLSCLVYWLCNPIAGSIAFALSMVSSNAADDNQMDEARKYGRASMWTSLIGLLISIIIIVSTIIWYVIKAARAVSNTVDTIDKVTG